MGEIVQQNTISAIAGEALEPDRLVKFSSAATASAPITVAYCDAGDEALGVSRAYTASGDLCAVHLLSAGVLLVEAGGTLTDGGECFAGADGKLLPAGQGKPFKALQAATDGAKVHVLGPMHLANHAPFGAPNIQTLAGDKTMTHADAQVQVLDPGGATRDVRLPAEAGSAGKLILIVNSADGDEPLVVTDDGDTGTIATIAQNEAGLFVCDGTAWHTLVGANT